MHRAKATVLMRRGCRLQIDLTGNFDQRIRENHSCPRNSSREPNETWDARWMGEEKLGEHTDVSSLLLDIKQNARRRREWLGGRVCDDAQRQ